MSYVAEISPQERALYQQLHLVPLILDDQGLHIAISEEHYDQRGELLDAEVQIVWHSFDPLDMDALLVAAYGIHALEDEDLMIAEALAEKLPNGYLSLAAAHHERTGEPVGDILVSEGYITELELNYLRAAYHGKTALPADVNVDDGMKAEISFDDAHRLRVVPLHMIGDTLYVASDELDPDVDSLNLANPYVLYLAPTRTVETIMQNMYRDEYARDATLKLMQERPEVSAHQVFSPGQKVFFIALLVVIIVCLVFWTKTMAVVLIAVASLVYVMTGAYRIRLLFMSLGARHEINVTADEIASLDERDLPVYTILIPLYKEAVVIPRLTRGLNNLDYPKSRLDIKLLCEEDDEETIQAILDLELPPYYHLMVVPDSKPKTKPKACNYGLAQARGEYVVIYDAEDRPDPHQLKKAIIAFRRVPEEVVCVQAKLNYFNYDQNILTRLFSVEYSMHFELLLPGLNAVNAPIPLGGTSNHFKSKALIELGGWDPFNVTEDADLGVRLARGGMQTMVIESTTLEEANSQIGNWIRQRSRWIKGYMQTWLVHMRNPFKLWNELGARNFISFNLVFGVAVVFLLNPIFWTLTTIFILTQAGFIQDLFPEFIYYAAAAMLVLGNFLFMYINIVGSAQHGAFGLIRWALLSPIYWGLMSWAAWKGFIQLFTNPFYWEKTVHGLDNGDHE